jgi:hypothetical protein
MAAPIHGLRSIMATQVRPKSGAPYSRRRGTVGPVRDPALRSPAIGRDQHILGAHNVGVVPVRTTRLRPLPGAR